jgi:hypothetical protein
MKSSLVYSMVCAALALIALPGSPKAYEFDISGFVGTHGCTNLEADVSLPGVEGVPETVVLRLELAQTPGLRLSCDGPPNPEGATFYSLTELVPGLRADATGSLPADAGAYIIELAFENYLWYFDLPSVSIELWISTHPESNPVDCSDWWECPSVEITAATLIVEPAVAVESSTWGGIKAIFD